MAEQRIANMITIIAWITGLFFDKKFVERKLEVMKSTYEKYKELARGLAGPAVIEAFGDEPFAPVSKPENIALTKKRSSWKCSTQENPVR